MPSSPSATSPGVEHGYELDVRELASLSADAAPAIAASIPELDPSIRAQVERGLSCLRAELRRGVDRFRMGLLQRRAGMWPWSG
jgi:hypothetical protein